MTTPPTTGIGHSRRSVPLIPRTVVTVWHRSRAKVNRLLGNVPLDTRATHESATHESATHESATHESTSPIPPPPLPYDILEMVIAYFTRDLGALKTCSLISRSWYSAAAPHLHHTLTLRENMRDIDRSEMEPLSRLHEFGLLHLVKTVRVKQGVGNSRWFVPQPFSDLDLCHFSTLANVHILKLQNVEIHRFMPDIEHYFGRFSHTLRSITLHDPSCTPQQLSHSLSLFSNLDDVGIQNSPRHEPNLTTSDTELVPFSVPNLQGRLALDNFSWVEVWTHLIASCGGPRFRHMDLRMSGSCAPVLFNACAKTLETLRFDVKDDMAEHLDLSPLKVLQSLQVAAWAPSPNSADNRPSVIAKLFSTITSPVFSELIITIVRYETRLPWATRLFRELRAVNEIRPFKLVFLLGKSDFREAQRELTEALDSADMKALLDFLGSPPTIRIAQSHHDRWDFLDFL